MDFLNQVASASDAHTVRKENAALRARVEELEQALRLHLAVAPDDPIITEPLERQLLAIQQRQAWIDAVGPPQHPDDERHWVSAYLDAKAQLASLQQQGRMRWSSEKPTKPGWYWWRNEVRPQGEVIEVTKWLIAHRVKEMKGHWSGPLTPPPTDTATP